MIGVTVDDEYMDMVTCRKYMQGEEKRSDPPMVSSVMTPSTIDNVFADSSETSPGYLKPGIHTERIKSEDDYVEMTIWTTGSRKSSSDSPAGTPPSAPLPDHDYMDIETLPGGQSAPAKTMVTNSKTHYALVRAAGFAPQTLNLPLTPVDSDSSLPRTPSMPNLSSSVEQKNVPDDTYMVMSRSQTSLHSLAVSVGSLRRNSERPFATLDSSYRRKRPSQPNLPSTWGDKGNPSNTLYEPMNTPLGSSGLLYPSPKTSKGASLDRAGQGHRDMHTAFAGLTVGGDLHIVQPLSSTADLSRSENCLARANIYEHTSDGASSAANNWRNQFADNAGGWNSDPLAGEKRRGRMRRDHSDGALNKIGRGAKNYLERIKKSGSPESGESQDGSRKSGTDQGEKSGKSIRKRINSLSHGIVNKIASPKQNERSQSPLHGFGSSQKLDGSPKSRRREAAHDQKAALHPASHGRPVNSIGSVHSIDRCQSVSPTPNPAHRSSIGANPHGQSPLSPAAVPQPHRSASKTM